MQIKKPVEQIRAERLDNRLALMEVGERVPVGHKGKAALCYSCMYQSDWGRVCLHRRPGFSKGGCTTHDPGRTQTWRNRKKI